MPNQLAAQDDKGLCPWDCLPDDILLGIFQCLPARELLRVSQVCKCWHRVALDEFLWKDLFYSELQINRSIPRAPGSSSWLQEYKRLYYHLPLVESEVLHEHRDQVLHVAFSHDGKLFSTSSKDGYIKVWSSGFPASVRYYENMKKFTWKYTQFSQFNRNDTLLLVSGVLFGVNSTSGEIVIFNMEDGKFELQCRVSNKPYDIFGTWFNDNYLLSGNIYWRGNLASLSVISLNKAWQALESEHECVVRQLYRFLNQNASSVRTVMVAKCPDTAGDECCKRKRSCSEDAVCNDRRTDINAKVVKVCKCGNSQTAPPAEMDKLSQGLGKLNSNIEYGDMYRSAESAVYADGDNYYDDWLNKGKYRESDTVSDNGSCQDHEQISSSSDEGSEKCFCGHSVSSSDKDDQAMKLASPPLENQDRYVIFTMGTRTYTPHQIGIKRVTAKDASAMLAEMQDPSPATSNETNAAHNLTNQHDEAQHDEDLDCDDVDYKIELHGHIIGMSLSPDERYLYVNNRPWPQNYQIVDPLYPPPIAQEIDIHVIDLVSMQEVGKMHHAHKAYTPNDECFFIFLNVCDKYVASGAEDKHGYLWDRHYGSCLARYNHSDVVNCVAFNPGDQEMLVTASDDNTVKIWRSRNRERQVKINRQTAHTYTNVRRCPETMTTVYKETEASAESALHVD